MISWKTLTQRLQGKDLEPAFLEGAVDCLVADSQGAPWEEIFSTEVNCDQEQVIASCTAQINALRQASKKLRDFQIAPLSDAHKQLNEIAQRIEDCEKALEGNLCIRPIE